MKIGFLGSGNMAYALGKRIRVAMPQAELYFYTPTGHSALKLSTELRGVWVGKLEEFPSDLEILFLAFKPQSLKDSVLPTLSKNAMVVSLLAAVNKEKLITHYGFSRIIRLMPNTPSEIGLGVLPITGSTELTSDPEYLKLLNLLSIFGRTVFVPSDEEFDTATPFTGCLPGILYYFFDTIQNEFKSRMGTPSHKSISERIIMEVVKGSVELYFHRTESLNERISQVASKGGLTEASLKTFEDKNFQQLMSESIQSAMNKAFELQKVLQKQLEK